jgi:hypothetical protein
MKNGWPHLVPLSPLAVTLIEQANYEAITRCAAQASDDDRNCHPV